MNDQIYLSVEDNEYADAPVRGLDRPVLSFFILNWEKIAWGGLLLVALILRLAALDNRTASHDESEHAWFAYNLYAGKGYEHNPVYHGPFIYHMMALFYLLFGPSDVTARVPTALFGFGIVALMWLTRRWLGRAGAFFAAALVTFSPALLHYSRHTRHDIYEIFWAVLLVIAVFRYLELGRARGERWIYVVAASLSLALASKEDAFIHGAALGGFLLWVVVYQAVEWVLTARRAPEAEAEPQRGEPPLRVARPDALWTLAMLGVAFVGMGVYRVLGLAAVAGSNSMGQVAAVLVLILLPPALAVGLMARRSLHRADADDAPRFSPPLEMALLLATLILPWVSPFLIKALGYDPLNYSTGIIPSLSVLAAMIAAASVIGLLWSPRRWLVAAGLFTAIFVVFFTALFTNGQGIATGVIGSLGYWLSQQDVARGSQPWYYYFIVTPPYEFLPIVLTLPVLLATLLRSGRVARVLLALLVMLLTVAIVWGVRGGAASGNTLYNLLVVVTGAVAILALLWGGTHRYPAARQLFLAFLPFFVLFSWIAYAIAGEKMPWLVASITLPMCIAGGWALGKLVERVQWRRWGWSSAWLAATVLLLLAAIRGLWNSTPFQGRELSQLSQTGQWVAAGLVFVAVLALLIGRLLSLYRQHGWPVLSQAAGVAVLTVIALLGVWTVRTTYVLNFINQDYVNEYLFYAHASPDPVDDMQQIEAISRRTVGEKQMKVAYDDDSSWPFNWYLRDWPKAAYFGANPSRESFTDAPVAIIGAKNLDKARPYLQRDYYEFSRRLIWWPNEDYKTASWAKIKLGLTDAQKRREFLDVLLFRRFATPMNEWPLVHRYSLFVRKDVAAQLWDFGAQPVAAEPVVDPYAQAFRADYPSQQIIGNGPGAEPGQLSFPRNVAVSRETGEVYVADSGNHRIQVFGPDGAFLRQWGSSCELYTEGLPGCVDPDGNGPLELGDGQMREPWGIALSPTDEVIVADTWNHRVQVFSAQGQFLRKWGVFATTNGEAVGSEGDFWGPRAVAVDAVGNVYVADTGNKRIEVFDAGGAFLTQYGGGGVTEGRLDEPVGLALAPRPDGAPGGRLYVNDTWNMRVQEFDVALNDLLAGANEGSGLQITFVKQWPVSGWLSQSVVNKPYIAVDSTGQVYVTDPEGFRVLAFDGDGHFQAGFGQYGVDPNSFALPGGIAIGPNDAVYIADADNHRIAVFPAVRRE